MEIENIPHYILVAARQRLGATDEEDTSYDENIKKMSIKELLQAYSAWELGDPYWATVIVDAYEKMKASESSPCNYKT